MKNRFISLIAAFTIHALLAIALYYSVSAKFPAPQTVVAINILSLGETAESGKASSKETSNKISNSERKESSIKYHQHSAEETQTQNSENHKNTTQKAALIFNPLPKIPDDLREEAFNSYAIARFKIAKDGTATVELIKPCSNPRLNNLLLKNLKTWKFAASNSESTQEIRVNFKVE
jgi:protein TonB